MTQRILTYSFYILFAFTPLFFLPFNNELFEYNKMMLVYALTIIITSTWIIKMINHKTLILNKTPLDIPLMVFLASQILATIFSIDPHTSVWGYYSRSNGGLLSIISYIVLYYAFVSNFKSEEVTNFLKSLLLGGLVVTLYAIPEHFGVSPSCIILTGQADANCWVQDVQSRVFATLGQPNWLAAYLEMIIFIAIFFMLTAKTNFSRAFYLLLAALYYMAFTFTYSRGAMLGMLSGMGILIAGMLISHPEAKGRRIPALPARFAEASARRAGRSELVSDTLLNPKRVGRFFAEFTPDLVPGLRMTALLLATFIIINLFFGSALTGDFRLIKQAAPPPRPGLVASGTQLETGGTESGQIRLIVWKGAIEIFKHYPLFGSGVETFGYSYYNFRPIEHNFVSEWDFLYNKAHNEYLNYLATTGIVGFLSYLGVIVSFIVWSAIKIFSFQFSIFKQFKNENSIVNWFLKNVNSTPSLTLKQRLIVTTLLAGYTTYLIQNIFGFSVVMIALLFYMFPALAFAATGSTTPYKESRTFPLTFFRYIYHRPLYTTLVKILIIIFTIYLIFSVIKLWTADLFYKKGQDYTDIGNAGRGYNFLTDAVSLNATEPLYRGDLSYAASLASVALAEDDATTSANLKIEADEQIQKAIEISPKNLSILRTGIRTYYELAIIDPEYQKKAIEIIDKAHKLAPTDPKILYNEGLVLAQFDDIKGAVEALKEAIALKPDYRDAYFTMGVFEEDLGNTKEAIEAYKKALEIQPDDNDSRDRLEELEKK
jgi:putative inorganic carbon (hco3(-)) transporter